jgi:hypothetical protein
MSCAAGWMRRERRKEGCKLFAVPVDLELTPSPPNPLSHKERGGARKREVVGCVPRYNSLLIWGMDKAERTLYLVLWINRNARAIIGE